MTKSGRTIYCYSRFSFLLLTAIILAAFTALASAQAFSVRQPPAGNTSLSDTLLTLTEIMFYPSGSNNEFVEIYNLSETDSINLAGYKIKYATSTADIIRGSIGSTYIKPRQYAVILEGDYDSLGGIYNALIPSGALILRISDNAFGSTGMSNSADRAVSLLRPNNDTLENYTYTVAQNAAGISDEKIIPGKNNLPANWKNALTINGSPGKKNTVAPPGVDLSVSSFSYTINGSSLLLKAVVKSAGSSVVDNYLFSFSNDANRDSVAQSSELLYQSGGIPLYYGDSVIFSHSFPFSPQLYYLFIAKIQSPYDEIESNNIMFSASGSEPRLYDSACVVINEIMYAPANGEPEWIELCNRSSASVNLKGWKITDIASTGIIGSECILAPGAYAVTGKDSSVLSHYPHPFTFIKSVIPILNNDSDMVVLKDPYGYTADSLVYHSFWGGAGGKSLEKISTDTISSSSTWKECLAPKGATPGLRNSVVPYDHDLMVGSVSFSSLLSVSGDDVSCSANIINTGKLPVSGISVKLYIDTNNDSIPSAGELTATKYIASLSVPGTQKITFELNNLPVGISRVFIVATFEVDDNPDNNIASGTHTVIRAPFSRNDIVINEIMYAPVNGEPEWIELYNNSDTALSLKGFSVADTKDTAVITKQNMIINPGGFIVVTSDSSVTHKYSITSPVVAFAMPSLNNTGDRIMILDSLKRVIDSVYYLPSWGGSSGGSIERINSTGTATDSANWQSCIARLRATPGRVNSVSRKPYDVSVSELKKESNENRYGYPVSFSVKLKNNGLLSAIPTELNFYYRYPTGSFVLFSKLNTTAIQPGDSLTYYSHTVQLLSDSAYIKAEILFAQDEFADNNTDSMLVLRGYSPGSVIINEIMYAPANAKEEWVELFNPSGDTIELKGWTISDIVTVPSPAVVSSVSRKLAPSGYIVIASDSIPYLNRNEYIIAKFGLLNNTGDGIVLRDPAGLMIDSMQYSSSWRLRDRKSLERISTQEQSVLQSNWYFSLSSFGSTPLKENSSAQLTALNNGLKISEILYEPSYGNSQFVEIFNSSAGSVQLGGTSINTAGGSSYYIDDTLSYLPAGAYFVLANDSSVYTSYPLLKQSPYVFVTGTKDLSLLKSGTSLMLRDAFGGTVDSVYYSPSFHNRGLANPVNFSLERTNMNASALSASNWATSSSHDGATPGTANSISTLFEGGDAALDISPNPFSPDNDGFEDYTNIFIRFPFSNGNVTVKLFDDKGRFIKHIANNVYAQTPYNIHYDGLDANGNPLRIGMYILLIEVTEPGTSKHFTGKKILVSARKL